MTDFALPRVATTFPEYPSTVILSPTFKVRLDQPLRALPFMGDDLDVTMRVLGELAAHQQVALHFPTVFQREDPWAGLG